MTIDQPLHIQLGHSEIVLRVDGIIQVNASDHTYSIEDIRTISKAINELNGTKKVRLLLVGSNYTSIDRDARHFLATAEAGIHSICKAFVIKSLAQRLLMNFLIKMNQTTLPVRFFTNIDSALDWLKTHSLDLNPNAL